MRLNSLFMGGLVSLCLGVGAAQAAFYPMTPVPADLDDLEHGQIYRWGIKTPWAANETIVSASIFFDNIRDWTTESNLLWVHLLDTPPKIGVKITADNENPSDGMASQGILLKKYVNLPATAQNLRYDLTADQITVLGQYALSDTKFGLGFDPDCHFYNCGIRFEVTTVVPEPASAMGLMGGVVAAGLGRRRTR
jgi:hypothetical protein